MQPIEAVLFDLDETLVRQDIELTDKRTLEAFRAIESEAGVDASQLFAAHRSGLVEVWHDAEVRVIQHGEKLDGIWVLLETYRQALRACDCDDDALARRAFDCFWQNRAGVVPAFDDAKPLLDQLKGRVRLAVITNGPSVTQLDKLQVNGLDVYFDLIVASGDIHIAKPQPAIFQFVLDKLNVSATNTWHIGDSLVSDVAGANNAGLTSVWINRHGAVRSPHEPAPHHEIASLSELPALLGLDHTTP